MPDIRFIEKDGRSVDSAIIRQRSLQSAADAGIIPASAGTVWEDAMRGDTRARQLIELMCDIQIVNSDAGFGFQ